MRSLSTSSSSPTLVGIQASRGGLVLSTSARRTRKIPLPSQHYARDKETALSNKRHSAPEHTRIMQCLPWHKSSESLCLPPSSKHLRIPDWAWLRAENMDKLPLSESQVGWDPRFAMENSWNSCPGKAECLFETLHTQFQPQTPSTAQNLPHSPTQHSSVARLEQRKLRENILLMSGYNQNSPSEYPGMWDLPQWGSECILVL